jgi:hypothetical protein
VASGRNWKHLRENKAAGTMTRLELEVQTSATRQPESPEMR